MQRKPSGRCTESGYLKAIIPEWSRIECLVTRDFITVTRWMSIRSWPLDGVDTLVQAPDDARGAFRVLLSETPDIHLLRLALLLHDIGKGGGTGEHSEESTRIAREVLTRWAPDQMEMDTVLYLIEHHLDLSSLMTSRDFRIMRWRKPPRTRSAHWSACNFSRC
jgi:[protein-PII] uridylyltransferase